MSYEATPEHVSVAGLQVTSTWHPPRSCVSVTPANAGGVTSTAATGAESPAALASDSQGARATTRYDKADPMGTTSNSVVAERPDATRCAASSGTGVVASR